VCRLEETTFQANEIVGIRGKELILVAALATIAKLCAKLLQSIFSNGCCAGPNFCQSLVKVIIWSDHKESQISASNPTFIPQLKNLEKSECESITSNTIAARGNQHPPVHQCGWMVHSWVHLFRLSLSLG
jgi:hypothetical protein